MPEQPLHQGHLRSLGDPSNLILHTHTLALIECEGTSNPSRSSVCRTADRASGGKLHHAERRKTFRSFRSASLTNCTMLTRNSGSKRRRMKLRPAITLTARSCPFRYSSNFMTSETNSFIKQIFDQERFGEIPPIKMLR